MLAGAWAALAGCNQPDAQLAVRTNPYFQGIPVPVGFDRNERESSYSTTGNSRRVLEVYEGGAAPIKVRNFYVSNMPANGWQLGGESLSGAIYSLSFAKDSSKCTITISKKSDRGWFAPTEARVSIEQQ